MMLFGIPAETLGYILVGGLLPPLIWLYFLLKEDAAHPEPKALIALAFVAGSVAVVGALLTEPWACAQLATDPINGCPPAIGSLTTLGIRPIIAWAAIEEILKYTMAAAFILWRRQVDEAPDYVIYMLTVALGFAAAENVLFLWNLPGGLAGGLQTADLRFLGSTLLHVVASSAVGFALAFSWQRSPIVRMLAAAGGVILAIALHTVFNLLIISGGGSNALFAFFLVWSGVVGFFALFEILKYFDSFPKPTTIP